MFRWFAAFLIALALPGAANAQTSLPASQAQIRLSFAPLVKSAGPAVVNVYARTKVATRQFSPFADDPFFRQFFGDDAFGAPRERVRSSLGSGVIVDPSGVIVTNNHVIKDATDIRVGLSDRREFDAKVLLADERTDLAVLKIDAGKQKLPTLGLGDSDNLSVGDLVLAIGNPFGVGQTVTSGIVSALARTQVGVSDYQFFIQTDAAINPGNSGGALIDMSGRLIGINTAIFSRSGGSIGIGFAIPSDMVSVVVRSAETGERLVRPWFGADLQDVTADIAESLGMARPQGVLVVRLEPEGPLAKAGIKVGDLVLSLDRREVGSVRELMFRIATKGIGSVVDIGYRHEGREQSARITLAAAPETTPRDSTTISGRNPLKGLVVANLSPAVADELDLPSDLTGVAVTDVQGGPAARFGFKKGDIITTVNGTEIDQVSTLTQALQDGSGAWNISVNRGGRQMSLRFRG